MILILLAFGISTTAIVVDSDGKFDLNGVKLYSEKSSYIYKTKDERFAKRGLRVKENCYIQGIDNCLEQVK